MTTHRGITFRLTLVFVLFASALVAGGGILVYASGRQQMLNSILAELQVASTERQSALEEWVSHLRRDVVVVSRSPAFVSAVQDMLAAAPGSTQAAAAHERVVGELRVRVGGGLPYLRWLVLDPQDGQVIADSDGQEEGMYREDQPYFVNGKVGPFVENVYYSSALQAPTMTISAPVMTGDGRLGAVLAARIDLREMNAIIQRRTGDRQTDDAFLVNTSRLFVTQPRLVADPAVLSGDVLTEAVNRCLGHGAGVVLADDYRGIPAIINYAWLPTRDMCLIVKVDQAEEFAPIEAFGRSVILAGGIALLAVAAIAIAMARSITRPVLRLQEGAARISRGEYDVRLPETGRDELGMLAQGLNQIAATLSKEQTQLRRRLERMYGLSSDLLCVVDFEGRFSEVNPAIEHVLGFGQGDLLGTPFLELVHPEDREATQAALATLAEGRGVTGLENRHRRKDGSWRWLLWNAAADTRERFIYAVGRDVTARRREEENLRRFATVVRDSNDAITIQDFEGRITAWNRGAELMYGYGEEEALLTNIDRLTTPGKVEEQKDFTRRLIAGEAITSFETQRVTKDGRVLDIWMTVTKLMDEAGRPIGIASTERDITARKRAEETLRRTLADLERSNKELEQFAYAASHDLQEPLRMVSSYTQLLAGRYSDQLDQDAHDFIAYAVDGANRMQRLIQDLLTYSRVSSRCSPDEPVDLNEALGEAVANLQAAIRESSALVTSGDLPVVSADRTQLVQVFQNLIGNAVKFRKKDEPPRVHVSARRLADEWIISVKDNGIGIDPQHFRRLFVAFQRLHGLQEYPGSGIGLALCQRIITRHGGRIWVESAPAQGSEFFFALTADRPPLPSTGTVS
jgi:PAS domain S-box-containing protein